MPVAAPLFSDNREGIQALPLSSLLSYIQGTLKNTFRDYFWIIAEVTGVSRNNGHYYFDLAEMRSGQVVAKCRANLWSYLADKVIPYFQQITGDVPRIGMELMLQVKVDFHLQYGLSLNIQNINPDHTLGNLERQKQETIHRLQSEGVYDLNKHYPLPRLMQRIAVISSETAAGWGDFHDQIRKSPIAPLIHIDLYPALMQGTGTTRSIYEALLRIQERIADYDTVVILRGGGSRMDLSAFDDYHLCVLIANFPLPIITAIGHERDTSVADMVANTSVKTPTAAAEFILRRIESEVVRLLNSEDRIIQILQKTIKDREQHFSTMIVRLRQVLTTQERSENLRLNSYTQNITSLLTSTYSTSRTVIAPLNIRLDRVLHKVTIDADRQQMLHSYRTIQVLRQSSLLREQIRQRTHTATERLSLLLQRIVPDMDRALTRYEEMRTAYDPQHLMRRGYIPVLLEGRQITSTNDIREGDSLRILLTDGEAYTTVSQLISSTSTTDK